MSEHIAFDSDKWYTWVDREHPSSTEEVQRCRLEHAPGAVRGYLSAWEPRTSAAAAVEATGNRHWIIGGIEQAGMRPLLVHPRKARFMMGQVNKTDNLDAQRLNRLQRNGMLPTVWIPPRAPRDLREWTRTRLVLVQQRARLKNQAGSACA